MVHILDQFKQDDADLVQGVLSPICTVTNIKAKFYLPDLGSRPTLHTVTNIKVILYLTDLGPRPILRAAA